MRVVGMAMSHARDQQKIYATEQGGWLIVRKPNTTSGQLKPSSTGARLHLLELGGEGRYMLTVWDDAH